MAELQFVKAPDGNLYRSRQQMNEVVRTELRKLGAVSQEDNVPDLDATLIERCRVSDDERLWMSWSVRSD